MLLVQFRENLKDDVKKPKDFYQLGSLSLGMPVPNWGTRSQQSEIFLEIFGVLRAPILSDNNGAP